MIQKEAYSATIRAGDVIEQRPDKPEVKKGAKVTLVISKGPESVQVPSGILKKTEGKATQLLEDYGFIVKVLKPAKSPKGKELLVIKVTPTEGSKVKPNSVITIEVK